MSEFGKRPVNLAGDMIAKLGAAPVVLKGAERRTRLLPEARALGLPEDLFRLVPDGEVWRLERRDGAAWHLVAGHAGLAEVHGRIAQLGKGETFVVLANATRRVLVDIHGTLSRAPLGLTYALPEVEAAPVLTPENAARGIGAGMLLPTPGGLRPAGEIRAGDLVLDRSLRAIRVSRVLGGSGDLVVVPAGALGGLPDARLELGPESAVVIRSELTSRNFGEGEVSVPTRLLAGFAGVERKVGPMVAIELAETAVVTLACGEVVLPGAAGDMPRLAQGRRARRLVADHARTGQPILMSSRPAKAAE